jgi:hypothetical protein
MYRNTTFGSLPLGLSRRLLTPRCSLFVCLIAFCGMTLSGGPALRAQGTSGGGIQGTVKDPSGAVVKDAEITATNTETGVQTTRKSGSSGTYSIAPLQAGPYNIEIVAKGFQRLLQENITVDNSAVVGYNPTLTIGGQNETVTVTDAPPFLDVTDATLGGTIENELYSSLPLSMNGGPRDPTAFQYLMPGVQENPNAATGTGSTSDVGVGATAGNSAIIGGTGQTNLNENYIEGVPVTNPAQQGSNNAISSAVSVDAVDQFSVQTSGASTTFGGAGSANYTIKSGGNQFHGTVFDFIRNTMFDTWGYFSKVPSASGFAEKPGEHQNSYGGSLGGPIFKDKLFFFGSYEGYHYTKISNTPTYITIPTLDNRAGNFTDELGTVSAYLVDPTSGGSPGARVPFQGLLNGLPTFNVIPTNEISSISNYLQSSLPAPTNLSTFQNYLASLPQANSDYTVDARLDYTLNSRNKFSIVGVGGNIGYGGAPFYTTQAQLPVPYASGEYTNQKTASGILSYVYIASQTLINTLKYGYTRNWGEGFSLTQGKSNAQMPNNTACGGGENSCAAGITNLPPGNASQSMPAITFSETNGPTAPANWASNSSTGPQGTNTYTAIDNLTWIKGRHNVTFGAQVQWEETNGASYGGYSQSLSLTFYNYETYPVTAPSGFYGSVYASFLVGAVYSGTTHTQSIQDVGARYRPISPYIQDNWQATSKLTLNLGIRYDYLQPYHEVKNRIAFLNPTLINPITGTPGVQEFAGFPNASTPPAYAPYICHCTTPVHPYNKNFEPRVGFAYAYKPSTVFAGSFAVTLTHAGGVGGGSGATTATGNNSEFGATTGYSGSGGSNGEGAFFLNPNFLSPLTAAPAAIVPPLQGTEGYDVHNNPIPIPCVTSGTCNPYSSIPQWTAPGITVNPLETTGNYNPVAFNKDHMNDYNCNLDGSNDCELNTINYADPYYGGRGPQFISYNFSVQRMINKKAVLTVAYSGSQTHFLPGGAGRGYATNTFSPDYDQIINGSLNAGGFYGANPPYVGYTGQNATVAQSLRPFPQFGGFTDLWGETGNANYNSLQISVVQRPWHNLAGFMNYTRAKEIDDTGIHRTQFPVGPQDGNFPTHLAANRVDRGVGTSNQTNGINMTFTYTFPIGRGQALFATNRIMGLIGGGWQLSGIYKYRDGNPIQVSNGGGCMTNSQGGQGTCVPDYNPSFDKRRIRINGRWGRGPGANATNFNTIPYLNTQAFECADSYIYNTTYTCGATNEPNVTYKLGNVARTAPDGLIGPGWWDVDMGLRRTFNVRETATLHLTFQVEADVSNATNSTFFNLAKTSGAVVWDNSAYGTVNSQNQQIPPRDWQFAGRFRF